MINIVFNKDNYIKEVTLTGHALFSEYGTDIVCASVSSMAVFAANACTEIDSSVEVFIDEEVGFLKIKVNEYLESIDTVLKVLQVMLEDLEEEYPKYISVNNGGESYD